MRLCNEPGCTAELDKRNKSGRCVTHNDRRSETAPRAVETFNVSGDTAELTRRSPENPRTLADLVRVCEIDTTEWLVERWVANKWEMGARNDKGQVQTTPLYQIKAWLKRNRPVIAARAEIASLLEDAKAKVSPRVIGFKRSPAGRAPDFMLELAIPDLHLGKLAWNPETGYAPYDTKIAERLFEEALDVLLARTAGFSCAEIILPIGNDLLHSDSPAGTTTKGTKLDTDSRFQKTFSVARRMITRAIDRLRAIAPVTAIMVPGNHDQLSVWHLGDSLECFFHKTDGVTIKNEPKLRKYHAFGTTAIMFTHGNAGKATDWPLLFATEQPEMFGAASFREIHTGHLHQTRLTEKNGVRVRISPALCPPDAWHSEYGFVGNLRGAEAYVYHRTEGLVTVAHFTVPDRASKAA